ncbi:MAG: YbgF trimerization domain-containing protein [Gammaproteobacteria bacterium]
MSNGPVLPAVSRPGQPVRLVAFLSVGLALGFVANTAQAGQAGPGIEERPAVTAAASAAASSAPDLSIAVFEQLQQYQAQIETLTGRIEELEHALSQAREQEKARYLDTDARLKQLEQAPKASAPVAATTPEAQAPAAGDDEKVLFDRARALVREKKYDEAITAFGEQIKQYPNGELFPSAMYWLGEMWLVASTPDAAKAGRHFRRVYNEFPKNSWAPAAMYRHGQLQCQGDDIKAGRLTLARVMSNYSSAPEAKKAETALKQCQ